MILPTLCQSCGIPLDTEQLKGTKTNGLKRMSIANFVMQDLLSNQI
jgi:hypothetical protein